MRYSVIDIGTNTMLLLIAEYDKNTKTVKTILDIQRVPRLGKGVDSSRNITAESVKKAVDVLNEYKKISAEYRSEKILATATSFIRDAKNKAEFLETIKKETGIDIEILSGDDEAKLTFIGAVHDKLNQDSAKGRITTIDIGGGSTEITSGDISPGNTSVGAFERTPMKIPIKGKSLDVGSVRLNEKYLKNHPPAYENLFESEEFVKGFLQYIDFDIKDSALIGVAGTVTTMAAIKLGLSSFDASKVDGTALSLNEIEAIFTRLAAMPIEELYALGNFMEGRADIIIPGILILQTFMERFGFDKITVSTKGLRYGTFIREILK